MLKSCCLLLFLFSGCLNLNITELVVPEVVLDGEEAVFSCHYQFEDSEDDAGLTVKWWLIDHQQRSRQLYQWVKGHDPQAMCTFESDDLSHNSSSPWVSTIRLAAATPSFSGQYRCVVSSYLDEDASNQSMLVYTGGEGPKLEATLLENTGATALPATPTPSGDPSGEASGDADDAGEVLLQCGALEVAPKPELVLSVNGERVQSQKLNVSPDVAAGRYNVTVEGRVPASKALDATLRCDLVLPRAPLNLSHEIVFTSGGELDVTEVAKVAGPEDGSAGGEPSGAGSTRGSAAYIALLVVCVLLGLM